MSATLVSLWTSVRDRLIAAGVDTPVLDARVLVEAGAGVTRLDIVTDPRRELSDVQVAAVDALTRRREAREPVSYIVGRKHFWTLDLAVTPDVLTPRPASEFVVEAALTLLPVDAPARILDLGTGSGAILLAILKERPHATGVGVDASEAALAVAAENARALGLGERAQFAVSDWWSRVEGRFHLVVSNPPYIAHADIDGLAPEIARFEPRLALDGGEDGLDAYRAILPGLVGALAPSGGFAFEVGQGRAEPVAAMAQALGLALEPPRRDLGGVARVVWGRS